jgi:hypothetical protein
MSYCPIEEAFKDPFATKSNNLRQTRKRNRNNNANKSLNYHRNNTNIVENFDCLNGSDQLDMNDYQDKHMLSRTRPENLSVDVNLNRNTEVLKREDEKSFYPDMSLESEYAIITDVNQRKEQGYRPPHPFTQQSVQQPSAIPGMGETNDIIINNGMYESFNSLDNGHMMSLEHDTLRQTINPSETIVRRNNEISTQSNQLDINIDKNDLKQLLKSYKHLESKLNIVIQKLNKMDIESDGKENVHDIILFAIFGVFFIYILDSVYRIGKKTI